MRNTYDFKLTQGGTTIHLAGERDGQGAPMLRLGSRADEAAQAGQFSTLRWDSFHRGGGQRTMQDPAKYDYSVGWDPTEAGYLRLLGKSIAYTVTTNATYTGTRGRSALIGDNSDSHIICLPKQILDGDPSAGAPTARLSPNGTGIFTGSCAVFGDRIFFGAQTAAGAAQPTSDQYAVRRSLLDTYGLSGAGTSDKIASFFASTGTRLFRVREDGATAISYASHTQQTGSDTPTWGTEYPIPLGARAVKDIGVIGPHLLIAIGGGGQPGQVLAMDTDGVFTPLVPEGIGDVQPVQFIPYMGGLALVLANSTKMLWFQDPLDITVVDLSPFSMPFRPAFKTYGGFCAWEDRVYAVQDVLLGRLILTAGFPTGEGWAAHGLSPIKDSAGAGGVVLGLRLRISGTSLYAEALTYDTNGGATIRLIVAELWNGKSYPLTGYNNVTYVSNEAAFYTSYNKGDSWITKRFTRVRGTIEASGNFGGGGTEPVFTITPYIDGVAGSAQSLSGTSGSGLPIPFSFALPTSAVGRHIQLLIQGNDNDVSNIAFQFALPIEVDYFHVPSEMDIVRIPVVAGAEELRPGGGLTKKSRGDTLQDIQSAVQTGGVWTLDWREGSGLPDWSVVPLSYEVQETADSITPGGGRSVIWLTLQRVA